MNVKRWAERRGMSYAVARRVGRLILAGEPRSVRSPGITAVYARMSCADQGPDSDRPVARVTAWAVGEGLAVGRVVTGSRPGLSGHRRGFLGLCGRPVTTIVAGHRGRFARFGADDDLVRDVTEVLTSPRAPLYGRRAAADRAARGIAAATEDAW